MGMAAQELHSEVRRLVAMIEEHNGTNIADRAFEAQVDALISVFYDDIGEITTVPLRTLFDLFLIKTLYVNRRSRDADVLDYLGEFLTRYLFTRELFPIQRGTRSFVPYLSDILEEHTRTTHFQNAFEAHRKFAENALFITGVFPHALTRRRRWSPRGRPPAIPTIDRSYFIRNGKLFYRLAAQHDLAVVTQQRDVLLKLATYFEIYMEALNEMSERYILGFDMNLIADKMLDNFNRYRRTGDERALANARKYAAILKVDQSSFPRLWERRRSRAVILSPPGAGPGGPFAQPA
jgi:hypothetical protein